MGEGNVSFAHEDLLRDLHLPRDVRKLSLGQTTYLINNLNYDSNIANEASPTRVAMVWKHGYDWRNHISGIPYSAPFCLYMDALARQNEIHSTLTSEIRGNAQVRKGLLEAFDKFESGLNSAKSMRSGGNVINDLGDKFKGLNSVTDEIGKKSKIGSKRRK